MISIKDYEPDATSLCQIPGIAHILAGVLGLKNDGCFVEVGAYDGYMYSNTYQLAKLGWRGLYVEPDPILFGACAEMHAGHSNVKVVHEFVSNRSESTINLYEQANMITGDLDYIHEFMDGNKKLVATMKSISLDNLLEREGIPNDFDLLVIDVEGHELSVLDGFSLLYKWHPTMIIIETHEHATNKNLRMHASQINEFMDERWYRRIYADAINSIFICHGSEAI